MSLKKGMFLADSLIGVAIITILATLVIGVATLHYRGKQDMQQVTYQNDQAYEDTLKNLEICEICQPSPSASPASH